MIPAAFIHKKNVITYLKIQITNKIMKFYVMINRQMKSNRIKTKKNLHCKPHIRVTCEVDTGRKTWKIFWRLKTKFFLDCFGFFQRKFHNFRKYWGYFRFNITFNVEFLIFMLSVLSYNKSGNFISVFANGLLVGTLMSVSPVSSEKVYATN